MTRHRDFAVISAEPEPLSFTVSGIRVSTGEPWSETFKCWPRIAPQAMADLALAMRVTPEGERIWNAGAVIGFVRRALMDVEPVAVNGETPPFDPTQMAKSQRGRWQALVNDSDRALNMQDDLGPILLWLAEEYTGRPTEPPST